MLLHYHMTFSVFVVVVEIDVSTSCTIRDIKCRTIEALENSNEERVLNSVAVPSQTRHPRSAVQ